MTLSDKLYKILIQGGSWKTILSGLWVTVKISVFALLIGTVLGALVCQLRIRKTRLSGAPPPSTLSSCAVRRC